MGKEDPWQRRVFWLTLIGFVVSIAVVIASDKKVVEVDHLKGIYTTSEPNSVEKAESPTISIRVKNAFLSPIHLSTPAYFFIEFISTSIEKPENFKILFDFGIASVEKCGMSPTSQIS